MTNRLRSATSSPLDVVSAALGRAAVAVGATGLVVVGLAHLDGAPAGGRLQAEHVAAGGIAAPADAAHVVAAPGARRGPSGPSPTAADATIRAVPSGPAAGPDPQVLVDAAASGLPSRLTSGSPPEAVPGDPAAGTADPSPPGSASAAPTPPPSWTPSTTAPASGQGPRPDRPTSAEQVEPAPEHIERIVRSRFGDRTDAALRVAHCESRYDPRAVSPGGGSWGLFQINRVHEELVAELGYEWEDLLDPTVNTHVARVLFDRAGGWSPWACAWAAR